MKKFLAILISALMVLAMGACSAPAEEPAAPVATDVPSEPAEPATESNAPAEEPAATPAAEVTHVVYGFPGTAARLNFVNDDGTYSGYEIDIVRELDNRLEDVEFELYCAGEFAALTPGLDSGKFQMVGSNITWKQERADNYLYSTVPYFTSPYVIGVRPDEENIKSIDDLQGRSVLTITGTATALFLEKYNEEHTDNPIILDYIDASSMDIMAQVISGRYDACLHNKSDFAIAKEERDYDLKMIEIPNANDIQMPDGFFLFAKGSEELQQKVDACLTEMRDDGTLSELCLRYFSMDMVPQAE